MAHDTTEFNFGKTPRKDLGRVGQGKSFGFYAHVALAIEADAHRTPLGVVGLGIHRRTGGKGQRGHKALQTSGDNEFRALNVNSSKCLDVAWAGTHSGANIQQATCTLNTAQWFRALPE